MTKTPPPAHGPFAAIGDAVGTVRAFLDLHPGLVALVVLTGVVVYLKVKAHKEQFEASQAITPKPQKYWQDMVRFTLTEDTRAFIDPTKARERHEQAEQERYTAHEKALKANAGNPDFVASEFEPVAFVDRWAWLTPRTAAFIVAGLGVLLVLAAHLTGRWMLDVAGALVLLGGWLHFQKRFAPVRAARDHAVTQMFDIANSRLKLVKGAELNKWAYVQVSSYRDLSTPEQVILVYPPSLDAGNPSVQQSFEMHFNASYREDIAWEYDWQPTNNRVVLTAQPPLPTEARFPFPSVLDFPWNHFPIGIEVGNKPVVWDPTVTPHMLLAGKTGKGKSAAQRNIVVHALQSERWSLVLVDPKQVELAQYAKAPNVIMHATEESELTEAMMFAAEQVRTRYAMMKELGVTNYLNLANPPKAVLVVIDEASILLSGGVTKEQKAERENRRIALSEVVKLGRACGVHCVVATQRPDAEYLTGDTRANIEGRLGMGPMDAVMSNMVLGDMLGTRTPGSPRGRGVWKDGQDTHFVQGYFLKDADVPSAVELAAMMLDPDPRRRLDPETVKAALARTEKATTTSKWGPLAGLVAWVQVKWAEVSEKTARGEDAGRGGGDDDDDDVRRPRRQPVNPPVEDEDDKSQPEVKSSRSLRERLAAKRPHRDTAAREFEDALAAHDDEPVYRLPVLAFGAPAAATAATGGDDWGIIDDAEIARLLAPAPAPAAEPEEFDDLLERYDNGDEDWL